MMIILSGLELGTAADWFSGLAAAAVLIWTIFETRKYSTTSAEVFVTELHATNGSHPTFGIINNGRMTIGIKRFEIRVKGSGALIEGGYFNQPPVQTVRPQEIFNKTIYIEDIRSRCRELGITGKTKFEYTFFDTTGKGYSGEFETDPSAVSIPFYPGAFHL